MRSLRGRDKGFEETLAVGFFRMSTTDKVIIPPATIAVLGLIISSLARLSGNLHSARLEADFGPCSDLQVIARQFAVGSKHESTDFGL